MAIQRLTDSIFTDLSANNNKIINVADPTSAQDVATMNYVDVAISGISTGGGGGSGVNEFGVLSWITTSGSTTITLDSADGITLVSNVLGVVGTTSTNTTTTNDAQFIYEGNDIVVPSGTTVTSLTNTAGTPGTFVIVLATAFNFIDGNPPTSATATILSAIQSTAVYNLGDLRDVTIISPANGHFLQYSGTAFVNTATPTFPTPLSANEAATMGYVDERIPATGVIPHTRSDDTIADTETEIYSIGDVLFSHTNRTLIFEISPTDFADIGWVEDTVVVVGFRTDGDATPREEVGGTVATLPSDTNADTNINVTIDLSAAAANRVQGLLGVGIYGTNNNDSGFIPANTSTGGRGISFISDVTEHRYIIDSPFVLAQSVDGALINDFAKIGQYQQGDLVLQAQLNRLSETVSGLASEGTGGYLERYVVDTGGADDVRVNVGSTADILHSIPLEFPAGGFTEGTGIDTFEAVTLTAANTMFPRPLDNTGGTYISVDRVQDYRIQASLPITYNYYTALTGGLVSATQSADITVNIHEAVIVSQTDPDDTATWVVEPGELIKSITQTHTVEAGSSHIPFSTTELGYGEVDLDFNFDVVFSNKGTDNGFFVEINTARYLNEAGRIAVDAIVIAPSGIRAVNTTLRPSIVDVSHGGQAITPDRILFEKGGVFMAYLSGDDLDVTPGSGFRVQEEAPAETYTSDLATAGVIITEYMNITGYDETWYEYENLTITGGNTLKVEPGSSVWSPAAPAIGSGGIYVDPSIAAPVIDIDNVFLFTT